MTAAELAEAIRLPRFAGFGYRHGVDFDEAIHYDRKRAWVEGTHGAGLEDLDAMPECPRAKWDAVSDAVAREWNRRLVESGMPTGEFTPKKRYTLLARIGSSSIPNRG